MQINIAPNTFSIFDSINETEKKKNGKNYSCFDIHKYINPFHLK